MKKFILPLFISIVLGITIVSLFKSCIKSCNKPSCTEMSTYFKSCTDIKIAKMKDSCDINDLLSVIDDCKMELIKKYD